MLRFDKLIEVPSGQNFIEIIPETYVGYVIQKVGCSNTINRMELDGKQVQFEIDSTYAPVDDVDPWEALDYDLGDLYIVVPPQRKLRIEAPAGTTIRLSGLAIRFNPDKEKWEQVAANFLPRYDMQAKILYRRYEFTKTIYDNSGGSSALSVAKGDEQVVGTLSVEATEKVTVTKVYCDITSGYDDKLNLYIRWGVSLENSYDPLDTEFYPEGIDLKALKPYKFNPAAKLPVPIVLTADEKMEFRTKARTSFDVPAGSTVQATVIVETIYERV